MSCNAIRDYGNFCCGGNRPAAVTGIIKNGYLRLISGKFIRNDGLDLTSGYANRALLPPNGSIAASEIEGMDSPPLCCNN